jgi:hypothetical protein
LHADELVEADEPRKAAAMKTRRALAMAMATFLSGSTWWLADAARADQKCLCNNDAIVTAMSDDDDACQDACSEMGGGGHPYDPADEGSADVQDESARGTGPAADAARQDVRQNARERESHRMP